MRQRACIKTCHTRAHTSIENIAHVIICLSLAPSRKSCFWIEWVHLVCFWKWIHSGEFAKTKHWTIKLLRCWRNGIWAAIPLRAPVLYTHAEWQKTTFVFSADVLNCIYVYNAEECFIIWRCNLHFYSGCGLFTFWRATFWAEEVDFIQLTQINKSSRAKVGVSANWRL